jgi:simple sugar transport system ATP-binding protein
LAIDPDAKVETLSVGEQQRVEILKVLFRGAKILILDEPTAVLTPQETDSFMQTLRQFRDTGHTILFITHKLREVLACADRVTILRQGKVVGTRTVKDTTAEHLAELMVGRSVLFDLQKPQNPVGEIAVAVKNLSARSSRGTLALSDASFEIRRGEILGIAGVEGNGQTELLEALMGLRETTGGTTVFLGKDITLDSPRERQAAGMALIPEDRHKHAVVADMTVMENAVLGWLRERSFVRLFRLVIRRIRAFAHELLDTLDVRPRDITVPVRALSGGNQQKLVVARELARKPSLLVVSQLTRGVDSGASVASYRKLLEAKAAGSAVLLISAELSEILSLSDRVSVLYRGRLSRSVETATTDEKALGLLMAGQEPLVEGAA